RRDSSLPPFLIARKSSILVTFNTLTPLVSVILNKTLHIVLRNLFEFSSLPVCPPRSSSDAPFFVRRTVYKGNDLRVLFTCYLAIGNNVGSLSLREQEC